MLGRRVVVVVLQKGQEKGCGAGSWKRVLMNPGFWRTLAAEKSSPPKNKLAENGRLRYVQRSRIRAYAPRSC
jgi:hypothetical protein